MSNLKKLTDIQEEIDKLNLNQEQELDALKSDAFLVYETMDNVNQVIKDLENMSNGEYSFNDYGELEYSVEVPEELCDLPFINDYLTKDYGYLTGERENDLRLAQSCGPCITVSNGAYRDSYYVYDHDSHKAIIEKELPWMDERYTAAVIELYQHKDGCFGDVVVIDYYGGYVEHFNTFEALGIKSELTKEELQAILDSYNQGDDDEE